VSEPAAMSNARAARYRRLALAQQDKTIADLLLKLADECDRGTLCTAKWRSARPFSKNEQPPTAGDAKVGAMTDKQARDRSPAPLPRPCEA
jgi:hypothetical protein